MLFKEQDVQKQIKPHDYLEMGLNPSISKEIWALSVEGTEAWAGSVKRSGYILSTVYLKPLIFQSLVSGGLSLEYDAHRKLIKYTR